MRSAEKARDSTPNACQGKAGRNPNGRNALRNDIEEVQEPAYTVRNTNNSIDTIRLEPNGLGVAVSKQRFTTAIGVSAGAFLIVPAPLALRSYRRLPAST